MAVQAPCTATLQSCCAMPSWCPSQRFQHQLTCWPLALSCSSTQLLARAKCLICGRPPWSLPSSRRGTPQTQPTTGQYQLASPSAGSMPALWYRAWSCTLSCDSCGPALRQGTGRSLAPSTLFLPFSMSLARTGTPTSLSTFALWISNQCTTSFGGISSQTCCDAWGCMATCWVLSSPCMMAVCCQCGLVVSVAPARVQLQPESIHWPQTGLPNQ